MALPKAHEKFSYADYRSWPESERWELIDGEAWAMSPTPSSTHQGIVTELGRQLANFLEESGCQVFVAPLDVKLSDPEEDDAPTIVQPDIIVCCDEQKISEQGIQGAPDFVIEVVSPSSGVMDRKIKFSLYEDNNVGEYWIVDPEERVVEVYRSTGEGKQSFLRIGAFSRDDRPGITALPGFEMDLSRVFREKTS